MRLIGFKEDKKTNSPTFIYNSENLEIEESNVDPKEEHKKSQRNKRKKKLIELAIKAKSLIGLK
tara:strand:+ start:329 stop:520 length:192 start_codon:yes stop_codon:yes gene_type:complete